MRISVARAVAIAFLFAGIASAQTIDPSWVVLYPGNNIQYQVNRYPAGTTFYLKAGTYRQQTIVPKNDNKFIGEAGAVLDGERVTAIAFSTMTAQSYRVTIQGLDIRNYASGAGQGAIQGDNGRYWVVQDNKVHNNAYIGIRTGKNWQVLRNKVYQNGVIGISGYKADNTVVDSNEVYQNNYAQKVDAISSEASGMIFGATTNVVIRNNNVHHNYATGIWVNHSLPTTIIERNTVTDNAKHGIFFASSYTAKIRYNTADRNGGGTWVSGTWLGRAGIVITNSPNVEIYGNTVRDNVNGITAMNTVNAMTAPLGPLKIQNLYVHDNVVRMSIGKSGIGQNTGETQVYTSWNNRFEHNTYYLGTNTTYYSWSDLSLSERQWQSYGNDLTGTFVTVTAPVTSPPPPLTVSCPANRSVVSATGSPVVVTYTATTAGGVAPITLVGNPASGSAFPVGVTSVSVRASSSDGQVATCGFSVTVTYSTPPPNPLTVSCPANRSVVSATGSPVVVTYTATTAGGVAPITLVGNPASGSAFPVGLTSVSVRASSSDGQVATCGFSVTVTSSTIDPTWVQIAPGDSIQAAVNAHAGATTFYLRAGVHRRQQVSPKTDNKFIGEAGAVLDGENVATYAFIASSGPQRVTISGLVIRNYASADQQGAIHGDNGVGWVIENNQVYGNREIGVRIGRNWQVRRNKVYRNGVIGISGYKADGSLIEGNEVYENNYLQAPEQPILSEASGMKFGVTANIVIRSNNVHHNLATGIWIDHSLPTTIIEHNTVTDNAKHGIFFESSYTAKIRYNTADRNGGGAWVSGTWLGRAGIVITNSPNVEIYGNTVRDNVNGITAMNSNNPMTAPLGPLKIQNLYVHDNVVRMSIGKSGIAQNTGETQIYTSWNNRFEHNTYYLGTSTAYYSWSDLSLSERQWQSYGNDLTGTFVH